MFYQNSPAEQSLNKKIKKCSLNTTIPLPACHVDKCRCQKITEIAVRFLCDALFVQCRPGSHIRAHILSTKKQLK